PDQRIYASAWHRHRLARDPGTRTFRTLRKTSEWKLALDLRGHRSDRALFRCTGPDRPALPEGTHIAGVGADTVGAAFFVRAGRRGYFFPHSWHSCIEKVQASAARLGLTRRVLAATRPNTARAVS